MLREPYSDSDMQSALAKIALHRLWDAGRSLAISLSVNPQPMSGDVHYFIANLEASLAQLPVPGDVDPASDTMARFAYQSSPIDRSKKSWIMLASLMYHLAGYCSDLRLHPQLGPVAYDALVAGAEEIVARRDEAADLQAIVGSAVSFAMTIGEGFVARIFIPDFETTEMLDLPEMVV